MLLYTISLAYSTLASYYTKYDVSNLNDLLWMILKELCVLLFKV